MELKRKYVLVLLCLFIAWINNPISLFAQEKNNTQITNRKPISKDSLQEKKQAILIKEITITDFKPEMFLIGLHSESIYLKDWLLYQSETLAQTLLQQGLINQRTRGNGALASPGIRGTNASHTAVLWNGMLMNSSLNGQVDLNQIPSINLQSISILKGSGSTLHGSGAIGGSILLETGVPTEKFLVSTNQTLGSFGLYQQQYQVAGTVKISKYRIKSSLIVYSVSHENNFDYTFTETANPRQERRLNNAYARKGFSQNNTLAINPNLTLISAVQFNQSETQVPSNWSNKTTKAIQFDDQLLGNIRLNYKKENWELKQLFGIQANRLNFQDPSNNLNAKNNFNALQYHIKYYRKLKSNILNTSNQSTPVWITGLLIRNDWADVDAFGNGIRQNYNSSIYTGLKTDLKPFNFAGNIRWGQDQTFQQPLVGDVALTWSNQKSSPKAYFSASANYAKSYRIPTLNDLFWEGSSAVGNPDLLPESGDNFEIGFGFDKQLKKGSVTFNTQTYLKSIDQWILWQQNPNLENRWSPQNLKSALAKGVEVNVNLSTSLSKKWTTTFKALYNFNISEFERSFDNQGLGNQLPNTPKHRMNITSIIQHQKGFQLVSYINIISSQFNDLTNSKSSIIKGYTLLNLESAKTFTFKNHQTSLTAGIYNAFDKVYFYQKGFPAPGRNYKIQLNYQFIKK